MARPRVHVGPSDSPAILDAIRAGGGALAADPHDADAVVWLGGPGDPDPLAAALAPSVRWVQLPSAGIEGWFASGLLDAGRHWTSAAGAYADVVAERALALLLAGVHRLPEAALARSWEWGRFGGTLRGATVAIVGAGGIGRALIPPLTALGAHVVAVTRRGLPVDGAHETVAMDALPEVWPRADHVVIAAPATAETAGLVDAAVFEALPDHAWVVNVARGSLIDTEALVRALADGAIAGAALDVTDPEPLPDGHPLWDEPRALITPHTANPPEALSAALAERVRENVARFAAGEELLGVIEVERGY